MLLTNSNRCDGFVELCGQVVHSAAGVVSRHGTHEDGRAALDLVLDDAGEVEFLLGVLHEALAHDGRDEEVRRRDQPVRAEGAHDQHAVHRLADLSCKTTKHTNIQFNS